MAYTLDSIFEKFPAAQLVGGAIVLHYEGKHEQLGRIGLHDGVLTLTPKGVALMEEATAPAKPRRKKVEATAEAAAELDL